MFCVQFIMYAEDVERNKLFASIDDARDFFNSVTHTHYAYAAILNEDGSISEEA